MKAAVWEKGPSLYMTYILKKCARNNFVTTHIYNKIYMFSEKPLLERTLPFFAALLFWAVFLLPSASAAAERGSSAFNARISSPTAALLAEKSEMEKDMSSSDANRRLKAAERLRHRSHGMSRTDLENAVQRERDPLVRTRLVQAVGSSGADPSVLSGMVRTLSSDTDPVVRQAAAQQLVKFPNNDAATDALARCIDKEAVAKVRYACVLSLSHSRSVKAMNALEKASKDHDPAMRRQTAFVLKGRKDDKTKKILNSLSKDKDAAVREIALQSKK